MADGEVSLSFKSDGAADLANNTLTLANALGRLVRFSEQLNNNLGKIPAVDIKIGGDTTRIADDFERIAKAFEKIPDNINLQPFSGDPAKLAKNVDRLSSRLDKLETNLEQVDDSAEEASESVDDFGNEARRASPKVDRLEERSNRLRNTLSALKNIASSVFKVFATLTAVFTAGAGVMSAGVISAVNYARRMSVSAKMIGASAGDVELLSEAFRVAGVESVDAAQLIAKMQRRIAMSEVSPEYKRPFDILGLKAIDLQGQSAVKQIGAIGEAVRNLTSQEARVAALMGLFEEQGARLTPLFTDAKTLEIAAKTLGSSGLILNRSAEAFSRVGYLLSSIGTKFRGFFLGVAEGVLNPLNVALSKITEVDTAKIGADVGKTLGHYVKAAFEAIARGQFFNFFTLSIEYAFLRGTDIFVSAVGSLFDQKKSEYTRPFREMGATPLLLFEQMKQGFKQYILDADASQLIGRGGAVGKEDEVFSAYKNASAKIAREGEEAQLKIAKDWGLLGKQSETIAEKALGVRERMEKMVSQLSQDFDKRFSDYVLPKTENLISQAQSPFSMPKKDSTSNRLFDVATDSLRRVGGFIGGVMPLGAVRAEEKTAENTRKTADGVIKMNGHLQEIMRKFGSVSLTSVYA